MAVTPASSAHRTNGVTYLAPDDRAAYLASDAAHLVTGNVEYVDAGYRVMG